MSNSTTTTSEQAGKSTGLLSAWGWCVVENIVTLTIVLLGCWLVSGWFALLLFNINYIKKKNGNAQQLRDLIQHMQIHAGYPKCGYMQMTTEQKELFDSLLKENCR